MSADAIYRVMKALQKKLKTAISPLTTKDVFIGPLNDQAAQDAALILFLYRLAPNTNLRNCDHLVVSGDPPPPILVYTNSLPLDLHVLITVGAPTVDQGEENLLKILGAAMQALNDDPGVGDAVGSEPVTVSFEPLSTEDAGRIWTLFPVANYRTSVGYVITPVWIDPPLPSTPASNVLQDTLSGSQKEKQNA